MTSQEHQHGRDDEPQPERPQPHSPLSYFKASTSRVHPLVEIKNLFTAKVEREGWLQLDMQEAGPLLRAYLPTITSFVNGEQQEVQRAFEIRIFDAAVDKSGSLHALVLLTDPVDKSKTLAPLSPRGLGHEVFQSPETAPVGMLIDAKHAPGTGENPGFRISLRMNGAPIYPIQTFDKNLSLIRTDRISPLCERIALSQLRLINEDLEEGDIVDWQYDAQTDRLRFLAQDPIGSYFIGSIDVVHELRQFKLESLFAFPESGNPVAFQQGMGVPSPAKVFAAEQSREGFVQVDPREVPHLFRSLHGVVNSCLRETDILVNPDKVQVGDVFISRDGTSARVAAAVYDEEYRSYVKAPENQDFHQDADFSGFVINVEASGPGRLIQDLAKQKVHASDASADASGLKAEVAALLLSDPLAFEHMQRLGKLDDNSIFAPALRRGLGVESLAELRGIRTLPVLGEEGAFGIAEFDDRVAHFRIPFRTLRSRFELDESVDINAWFRL